MSTTRTEAAHDPSAVSEHLTLDDRTALLRYMLLMRGIEERAMNLYRQGKVPGSFYDGYGQEAVSVGGVMGRWDAVVGSDIAAHCRPETFEAGILTVRADSTAWATQVHLLSGTLLTRLADEVGEGTVTKVVVRGPTGPSWRRGPRVAPGSQGPRESIVFGASEVREETIGDHSGK